MPDKKLKVKGVGVGDPTFVLRFELENMDGRDQGETVKLNRILAVMDNSEVKNPVLNEGSNTYPEGKEITVLSSFEAPEPDGSKGIISDGIIHVPTSITFEPTSDILHLEYEGNLPYRIDGNTIFFPKGIDLISPEVPSLEDGKQTVALHARAGDISEQGTNVFLANTFQAEKEHYFICTSEQFVSSDSKTHWEITSFESEGYCLIMNKERNEYLGSGAVGYLTWYSADSPHTDRCLQWAIVNNGGKTSTIQNLQAVADNRASFLTANTKVTGGDVQLSENSTPWYLHIRQ